MEKQALTPQQEHEEALAYCERAWPDWHRAYARRERAGGHSAESNLTFSDAAAHMDYLLEDLFAQTVIIEGVQDGSAR